MKWRYQELITAPGTARAGLTGFCGSAPLASGIYAYVRWPRVQALVGIVLMRMRARACAWPAPDPDLDAGQVCARAWYRWVPVSLQGHG